MKESPILILAAHPDDEVLGAGGALARWSAEGAEVAAVFFADGVGARGQGSVSTDDFHVKERRQAARNAAEVLGISRVEFLDFPDNRLDTVPLLEIAQAAERWIGELRPEVVLTHHAGDLNIDHRIVHQAVMTACRPQNGHPVRRILGFEVPSSTEWQAPGSGVPFEPNVFVDITATLDRKREALRAYAAEMREWPHPRSLQAVEHLARWRGATVGVEAAEAFVLARQIH